MKIKKHLDLKSSKAAADTGIPTLEKTSDGEITFDTKSGAAKKSTFKEVLLVSVANSQVKVPLTVSYRLLSAAEVAKLDKEAADLKAKIEAEAAERNRPLDDGDVRQALAELKSPDKRRAAAERLAKGPPNDQRDKVAKALATLLKDPDNGIRKAAALALGVWGTTDNVPALIKLLDDDDVFLKSDVMKALAKLPDDKGAEAVAKQLPFDRGNASRSLQTMGPLAEPQVIPYLDDRDEGVRTEACKILAAIGSAKSVEALEKLSKKSKHGDAREAEKAIKQIASRTE